MTGKEIFEELNNRDGDTNLAKNRKFFIAHFDDILAGHFAFGVDIDTGEPKECTNSELPCKRCIFYEKMHGEGCDDLARKRWLMQKSLTDVKLGDTVQYKINDTIQTGYFACFDKRGDVVIANSLTNVRPDDIVSIGK